MAQRVTAQDPDVSFSLRFGFHTFSMEDLSQPRDYETYFGECGMQSTSRLTSGVPLEYLAIRVSTDNTASFRPFLQTASVQKQIEWELDTIMIIVT
jgi:hypothetical protein